MRLPGFYRLSVEARLELVAKTLGLDVSELKGALENAGLRVEQADRIVENVIGTFALPFALAPNFRINGRDVLIPMVVEEPSVVAAAGHGAKMIREGGGFEIQCDPPLMVGQIQLFTEDVLEAKQKILGSKEEILDAAAKADPVLVSVGGGPRDLEVRVIKHEDCGEFLVVHLLVDVRDAMGANAVNTMTEAVAPMLSRIAGARYGLRILTNLADRRLVRARARVPAEALNPPKGWSAAEVMEGIVGATLFAEADPYRAVTHNKGIMNGVDAVVIATGNDWRAVEAGAHAYAARSGKYQPLCIWRKIQGHLEGYLEMPMQIGIVGGLAETHAGVKLSLKLLGAKTGNDVAMAAAAAGMANNLAALRALATEGIQRGHMALARRIRGKS